MTANPLGRINVTTPGTPVPLSANPTARASKIFFQVIPGLTGKGYIGKSGMVRATLANVVRVLWPNTSGGIFGFVLHRVAGGFRCLEPGGVFRGYGRGGRGAAGHLLDGIGR